MSISIFRTLLSNAARQHPIPPTALKHLTSKFHWLQAHTSDGTLTIKSTHIDHLLKHNPAVAEEISILIPHYKSYLLYLKEQERKKIQSSCAHLNYIRAQFITL